MLPYLKTVRIVIRFGLENIADTNRTTMCKNLDPLQEQHWITLDNKQYKLLYKWSVE